MQTLKCIFFFSFSLFLSAHICVWKPQSMKIAEITGMTSQNYKICWLQSIKLNTNSDLSVFITRHVLCVFIVHFQSCFYVFIVLKHIQFHILLDFNLLYFNSYFITSTLVVSFVNLQKAVYSLMLQY